MNTSQIERSLEQYANEVLTLTKKTDWNALSKIVEALLETRKRGSRIYTAGNGGSLTTASHMVNDFTKGCRAHNRTGFDIECLGDSNAVVTCLANDFSYNDIYSIPLRTKGRRGDTLVYFSGSGNSPNLLEVAKTAREMGIVTIGFLGRDGGALKALSDYYVIAPSNSMEQIEDMHMLYEHNMVCTVRSILEDEWGMEIVKYPQSKYCAAIFDMSSLVCTCSGTGQCLVPGSAELLAQLKNSGYSLFLVGDAAAAKSLGLDSYFGNHIYAASTAQDAVKQIIDANKLSSSQVVSFTRGESMTGYVVGVAYDEARGKGIDLQKRNKLLEAGAALIIPDFSEAIQLAQFLA